MGGENKLLMEKDMEVLVGMTELFELNKLEAVNMPAELSPVQAI